MRYEDQRALLTKELQAQGIDNPCILKAFLEVPREDFVTPEHKALAYHNRALPIADQQTISQPLMVAMMLQLLELTEQDIVLEIGTGSGYQTALLAALAKEVCSIERIENLSLQAQKLIKKQGIKNAFFRIGDGSRGWEKAYPPYKEFSRIIVSAGAKTIPTLLLSQLAEGGIMIIPVGDQAVQKLIKLERVKGEVIQTDCGSCAFVPLITQT